MKMLSINKIMVLLVSRIFGRRSEIFWESMFVVILSFFYWVVVVLSVVW